MQSTVGGDVVAPRSFVAPRRRPLRAWLKSDTFWAIVVISPSVLAVLVFIYAFILWTVYISVINWNDVAPNFTFVGLQNFVRLFQKPRFITDLRNTAVFSIFFLAQCLGIGLLLAILLDQKIKGEAFFRTVFVLPFAVSAIVTGVAWKWLMVPSSGLNAIFGAVGLGLSAEQVVRRPEHRHHRDVDRRRLADVGLHHGAVPGWPAGCPG